MLYASAPPIISCRRINETRQQRSHQHGRAETQSGGVLSLLLTGRTSKTDSLTKENRRIDKQRPTRGAQGQTRRLSHF